MNHAPATTLLIGATGMLGRAFVARLAAVGVVPIIVEKHELNLADHVSVSAWQAPLRSVILNCAAYTDVDGAERDVEFAHRVNGDAIGVLAHHCKRKDATLVHFSTDYVFSGTASKPYPVDAPIQPLNAYGASKALGEQLIRHSGCKHLILRTSWLYAPWGKNFVLTMKQLMKDRDVIKVVNDQRGRPTSAEHLAATTLQLLRRNATGTYHVTDGGECTWYDFARQIAHHIGYKGKVEPCTTDQFPRPAQRPPYSVLDLSQTEKLLGPMPDWRKNLAEVLLRLES